MYKIGDIVKVVIHNIPGLIGETRYERVGVITDIGPGDFFVKFKRSDEWWFAENEITSATPEEIEQKLREVLMT